MTMQLRYTKMLLSMMGVLNFDLVRRFEPCEIGLPRTRILHNKSRTGIHDHVSTAGLPEGQNAVLLNRCGLTNK